MAITIVGQPEQIHPGYNPIVYYINSTNKNQPGFRYLIQVYNAGTATLLREWKVAPRPTDGIGYIDVSKIIQTQLNSYLNINSSASSPADSGTVYSYDIKFGEEYSQQKSFSSYAASIDPLFPGLTRINSTGHGYSVGDSIVMTTNSTYTDARQTLNGIFNVVSYISPNAYMINLPYPGALGPASGTTRYADNRITPVPNLANALNRRAFNAAYSFENFLTYSQNDIILGASDRKIITNAPSDGFYIRPDQKLFWNFWDNKQNLCRRVIFENDAGEQFYLSTSGVSNFVKQVNVADGANLVPIAPATLPLVKSTTKYYDVWSTSSATLTTQSSEKKRIYVDQKCAINETQILFLDRAGSWSSFSFQLRQTESGNVTRQAYRKELGNLVSGSYKYNTTDTGMTNWHISNEKTYTLNTDWMTDEMSVYFEELVTSPTTYIKFDGSNNWLSCLITDTNYQVERSKNKKLIRKTINVKLANNDNINI